MHFRAPHRLQSALHLVRYRVRISRRQKDDASTDVVARVDELAGRLPRQVATAAVTPLVELTGGEPLLQEEIYPLAEQLLAAGLHRDDRNQRRTLHRRTAREVIKIVDVKCPDSGEAGHF